MSITLSFKQIYSDANDFHSLILKGGGKKFLKKDFYKYGLPSILLSSFSGSLLAQTTGGGKKIDMTKALADTKEQVFTVLDWAFILVIVGVFIIGAGGLLISLSKIFTGRVGEALGSLVVSVIAIIITVVLVGVFYTYYLEQRGS